ncbi:MAG: signal peptidase I [Oscillospiraceae bacterium]|nr:signal peptidase I [Oscillospiraceae bacterium]
MDEEKLEPIQEPGEPEGKPARKKLDFSRELFDWAQSLVFAFVGIVLLFAFAFSVFSVSQESMTNTLLPNEMIMISRLPYTPKSGDIVLFVKHGWPNSINDETGLYSPLVKRIIGIPGDEIEFVMNGGTGTLYINGQPQDEPYIRAQMNRWGGSSSPPMPTSFTVPDGHVFVMGDNRNGSHDSRDSDIGFIDQRSILGRVVLRLTPLSKFGTV